MKQEISNRYKGSYAEYIAWCDTNRGKRTKKLSTREYKYRSEFFLSMLMHYWWGDLASFVYNSEPIQSECYWRILETMEYIFKLKIYRGNKKKLLRTVVYKWFNFDTYEFATTDWWGEPIHDEARIEIKNEIDNIIDVLSHNSNLTPKQYLDNYIEKLEDKWQK